MSRLLFAAAGAALLLWLSAPPAEATIVRNFTLGALTLEADVIVRGEVVDEEVVYDSARGRVYTHSVVRVDASWRGPAQVAEHIVVRQIGGVLDGLETAVVGTARLGIGDEVVLFLRSDGFFHYLVGMAQGHYEVLRTPGDAARVARSAGGLLRTALVGPSALPAPERATLAELHGAVQEALAAAGVQP